MQNNKIIVAIFIFVNLFTTSIYAQDKTIDQIVAVIGQNIILKSDVESIYLQNQAQGITSDGDMKCDIMENLLVDKLMVSEAELDSTIIVTDNQINQQLDARIDYFVQHLGSEEAVEQYFKKPIIQLKAELQDVIRNEIYSSQMKQKLMNTIKITPSEVRYYYKNLPEDEKPKVNTQYKYAQITAIPRIKEKEENRIKKELRDIKKRVEDGENFAMFAVMYSEGPSASNGGDLGYFGKAQMDPAFSQAAFNLKPSQVSNVVKSDFGYHIIQMIDRKGEKIHCRHIIMKPKIDTDTKEMLLSKMDSIVNNIRKGDATFEETAMRFSDDKNSRNNGGIVINPQTMSSQFAAEDLPPTESKVLTKLNIGEISNPFVSIDEKQRYIIQVVKLIDKIDAHTANLTEDYPMVSDMFLQKKQEEAIENFISERQSKTYIHIDDTYATCEFKFKNWVK